MSFYSFLSMLSLPVIAVAVVIAFLAMATWSRLTPPVRSGPNVPKRARRRFALFKGAALSRIRVQQYVFRCRYRWQIAYRPRALGLSL